MRINAMMAGRGDLDMSDRARIRLRSSRSGMLRASGGIIDGLEPMAIDAQRGLESGLPVCGCTLDTMVF